MTKVPNYFWINSYIEALIYVDSKSRFTYAPMYICRSNHSPRSVLRIHNLRFSRFMCECTSKIPFYITRLFKASSVAKFNYLLNWEFEFATFPTKTVADISKLKCWY
jgi:hypothetical protein